ncbi:DUF6049 family protein [Herbiconiux moechotypicola]|uniref:DUF6049 family protein n=1 Tax=Herbiconiux moechotypicola TaxID=637393 RepID=UPI0031DDC35E|nr:DUF6049 family protein [Herbiconiux moechotypicola]
MSRAAPAIAVSVLVAGALLATPGAPASATEAEPSSTVTLSVTPGAAGTVAAGEDLLISVSLSNDGSTAMGEGTLTVELGDAVLDDAASLSSWLAGDDDVDRETVSTTPSSSLGPGSTHSLQLSVPAALVGSDGTGVYPLSAELVGTDGAVVTSAHSAVVVRDAASAPGSELTVIAPLTSVASSTGLIQAAALEAFTAPDGVLTRELDAVYGRPVTLAVDPRIIVSIRALGSTAPESAVAWLERLDAAPNPIIPLTFGDSDISGERQAGSDTVLQPTSFAYALDAADFTDVDELIEPEASSTPTPTGTAEGTADAEEATPAVPTLDQLLDWDYTSTSVAWPRASTVVNDDLPVFASSGYDTTIVDSSQLSAADGSPLPVAGTVNGQRVLVADHAVSDALQRMLAASGEAAKSAEGALLNAALAVRSGEQAGAGTGAVLAVLDRTSMNLAGLDQALSAVTLGGQAVPAPVQAVLDADSSVALTLTDVPQDGERIQHISALLADGRSLDAFSSVLSDPSLLTGQTRSDLLALLSNTWTTNTGGWNVAVGTARDETQSTLSAVQVVDGSSINMVANQANLPVTVSNDLRYPVTVVLHVTPSNGRLVVEQSDVTVTIEAESRRGAQIPLEAGVANGPVLLNMQVLSPTGVLISVPSPVLVNVSADWETWGTVIAAVLVVGVFGFGIVRNILRRRRQRRNAVEAPGSTEAADD